MTQACAKVVAVPGILRAMFLLGKNVGGARNNAEFLIILNWKRDLKPQKTPKIT